MNKPTTTQEQLKKAPHWMDCNCICHGFHDNTGTTCPHCYPENHPDECHCHCSQSWCWEDMDPKDRCEHCQPTKTTTQEQLVIMEKLKKARECISLMRADMRVIMTDGSKGEEFSAVSLNVVNNWFDILEKQIPQELTTVIETTRKETAREVIQDFEDNLTFHLDGKTLCVGQQGADWTKFFEAKKEEYLTESEKSR